MGVLHNNIKWVMLLTGVITCSTLLATISPQLGLTNMFGAYPPLVDEPIMQIVVRNWGALIALVGGMLIYAAFHPSVRRFTLVVACISKATFISLVLVYGGDYLAQASIALVFDGVVIALFLAYLLTTNSN